MGSFKNKIGNKKKKKQDNVEVSELIKLKKKMKEQFDGENYVDAMDTMAEIAEHKKMDPEIMLMGATCYFMTEDYERAARWIDNTLAYDPQNVGAKILLGRLCIIQDKLTQGFEVLQLVIDKHQSQMSGKNKEDLMKILEYCHVHLKEDIEKYPTLVSYYKDNGGEISPFVKRIKLTEEKISSSDNHEMKENKAKAAVDRLRALLNKSKVEKISQHTESVQPEVSVTQSGSETEAVADKETSAFAAEAADEFMERVMNSKISWREKIQSLNNFASGLYLADEYDEAMNVLKKALELDCHDSFVLRNMAYVCVAKRDKEKALAFAKNLPMVDFALLKSIKEL